MILLAFAHKLEASNFIEAFSAKKLEHPELLCFEGKNTFILITGEGLQNAFDKTSLALAREVLSKAS